MFRLIGFEHASAGARRFGCAAKSGAKQQQALSHCHVPDVKLGSRYIKLPPARRAATGVVGGALGLRLLCGGGDGAALCMPEGKAGEVGDDGEKNKAAAAAAAAAAADGGDDAVTKAIAAVSPYLSQMGMGSFFGLTSGYALKKIGKMAAFGTGCIFMLLQGLAYNGIIEIHWGAVQDKAKAALDLDGDGKLDAKDLVLLWKTYLKPMFTYHLPGAVGFPLGFVVGFKNG